MKTKRGIILASMAILIIFSSACGIFKKKAPAAAPEIVFGWGGGFTGMVEQYSLLKDGTLKKGTEVLKKLDNKQMRTVMKLVNKVNFAKMKVNDPGNLYYFLTMKTGDTEQKLQWNDQSSIPAEVRAAYDALIALTK